jgi:hypothetical protein
MQHAKFFLDTRLEITSTGSCGHVLVSRPEALAPATVMLISFRREN